MAGFNKNKIINDPLYGFLTIPTETVYDVIQHPYVQRLRRIRQLGLSELVYPGATHTRFHHALGALNLMIRAIETLKRKGIEISDEETEAVYLGILLHDIGHGPFSHTLEQVIVKGVHHEKISELMMERINMETSGKLELTIRIFKGEYFEKPFLGQLISGQLDMDRLDYLLRDSFYSGVSEGVVGTERIINMLHVVQGNLVVEEKGIYSVEKFLVARRLMYWQVYLHKTALAADELLFAILQRARELAVEGIPLGSYHPLIHFLGREIHESELDDETLDLYAMLDDNDIINALKTWSSHSDRVLSVLSQCMLNRNLPKIVIQTQKFLPEKIQEFRQNAMKKFSLSEHETEFFIREGIVENNAYKTDGGGIPILGKDGVIRDVAEASDNYNLSSLKDTVTKYYLTYWR
ncbi:MAG: HD domain-containing protein [Bacteroidetes bacterium]|nr:HD domain-containing protein [Bacteroidota bacterium]